MIRQLILFLITLQVAAFSWGQTTISITNQKAKLYGKDLYVFQDEENSMQIDEAIDAFYSQKFTKCEALVYSVPATTYPHWFAITISNETPNELWLNIPNAMLDSLHFFKVDEQKQVLLSQKCGIAYGREASYGNFFSFWFKLLEEGENQKTFFFKASSNKVMDFPFQIGSKEELYKNKSQRGAIFSFFIGSMCFILLYSLSLFFYMKERVYLYYSCYVFFVTSVSTLVNGYPFVEYIFGLEIISNYAILLFVGVIISVIFTTVSFLSVRNEAKLLYKIFLVEIGLALMLGLVFIFIESPIILQSIQLLAVISFLTCLIASINRSIKKVKGARLFLLGWTVMFSGAITQLLVMNGFIELDLNARILVIFPILIEVLIFAVALGVKIRQIKEELIMLNMSLKRSNQELKVNNEDIDSFNYHVSHELKTVMNNGKALSKMALKYIDKENVPKVKEILTKLTEVTTEGSNTVKSFLTLGKANSFLRSEERTEISVTDRIQEIIQLNGLEGKVDVEIDVMAANIISLHQVAFDSFFSNFITNTVKYNTSAHPKAWVSIVNNTNEIVIAYKDNSIGIDMKTQSNRIFQPFVRIANDLEKEGSGVGLYLVKKMVENYKGTINLESELGNGVSITIRIPDTL